MSDSNECEEAYSAAINWVKNEYDFTAESSDQLEDTLRRFPNLVEHPFYVADKDANVSLLAILLSLGPEHLAGIAWSLWKKSSPELVVSGSCCVTGSWSAWAPLMLSSNHNHITSLHVDYWYGDGGYEWEHSVLLAMIDGLRHNTKLINLSMTLQLKEAPANEVTWRRLQAALNTLMQENIILKKLTLNNKQDHVDADESFPFSFTWANPNSSLQDLCLQHFTLCALRCPPSLNKIDFENCRFSTDHDIAFTQHLKKLTFSGVSPETQIDLGNFLVGCASSLTYLCYRFEFIAEELHVPWERSVLEAIARLPSLKEVHISNLDEGDAQLILEGAKKLETFHGFLGKSDREFLLNDFLVDPATKLTRLNCLWMLDDLDAVIETRSYGRITFPEALGSVLKDVPSCSLCDVCMDSAGKWALVNKLLYLNEIGRGRLLQQANATIRHVAHVLVKLNDGYEADSRVTPYWIYDADRLNTIHADLTFTLLRDVPHLWSRSNE